MANATAGALGLYRHNLDIFAYPVETTGGWGAFDPNTAAYNGGWIDSQGVQSETLGFDLYLAKGTWQIEVVYRSQNNNGILRVKVDGTVRGEVDCYSAGTTANNIYTSSTWVVSNGKKSRIIVVADTKNASSSGYSLRVQRIYFKRVSA